MTDDSQQRAHEADTEPADAEAGEVGEVQRLCERLAAGSRDVRGDAERALDRAARLCAERDPRAGIAVSACRDALGVYQEAVDRSLREACQPGPPSTEPPPTEPSSTEPSPIEPPPTDTGLPAGPRPPTGSPASAGLRVRHRVARGLAAAAMAGVLGLVGWGGLPSWSTVTATSSGQIVEAPSETVLERAAPEPPADPRRQPAGDPASPAVGDARPAPASPLVQQGRDVRRLLAATLPDVETVAGAPYSVAAVANALRATGEAAVASLALPDDAPSSASETPTGASPSLLNGRGTVSWLLEDAAASVADAVDAAEESVPDADELVDDLPAPGQSDEPGDADAGAQPGEGDATDEAGAVDDGDEAGGEAGDGDDVDDAADDQPLLERDDADGGDDVDPPAEDRPLLDQEEGSEGTSEGSSADGVSDDAEIDR